MSKIVLTKADTLQGCVKINGAKNAALPILAATLLANEPCVIKSIPPLADIENMCEILKHAGYQVRMRNTTLSIQPKPLKNLKFPYELTNKLRASFLIAGPLLAKYKHLEISYPGGCAIGARPVDLHLKGFEALGAIISKQNGYIEIFTDKLTGNKIYLDFPSVGATENLIMAACLAEGQTVIENAAIEPEITDLANFLNSMGAEISGAGTDTIKISGVKDLSGADHRVIPDRIEAGTYMVAAAACHGHVTVSNVICEHLKPIIAKLRESGIEVIENYNSVTVNAAERFKPIDLKTLPYPGFPTDMQAQFSSYLSGIPGTSIVTETIFENRFMHLGELKRMGANIKTEGRTAVIEGAALTGAKVKATDLRAGAALVIAGLHADGETEISDCQYITRGYYQFYENLNQLGANIVRID